MAKCFNNICLVNKCYTSLVGRELYHDERITAFGLFAEAYTGLASRFSAQLAEHSLTLVEFEVLVRLARSEDQEARMSRLAAQVSLTTSGLTRVVDRLERGGLVERRACPQDRRGFCAVLTQAGHARLSAALPDHLAMLERYFLGRFSADERHMLVTRLRAIRDEVHPDARPAEPEAENDPPAV